MNLHSTQLPGDGIADEAAKPAAEPAAISAEEFLLKVIGAIRSPVFVKDEQFRLVFVNEAFCALLRRDRADLIGQTDFDIAPAEQAQIFREADMAVFASNAPHESEEALSNPDGAKFWVVTRKSVFEVPGRGRYLVGVMSDITERRRMEIDLSAAKIEAENANHAKSQFLANMSHELRTPLNAIIGFSEMIKNELFGAIEEQRYKSYAEDIHHSGSHLLRLINDILDLTKIDSGKYELHEADCVLANTIAEVIRMMQGLASRNGLTLTHSINPDLPYLFADERALRQIIVNFLSNAIKFTPTGRVEVHAEIDSDDALLVSVSDTGIGIAPDDLPRALSPFHQLENAWDRRYEGTGLGLPLAKGLLNLHGGTLHIESEPRVGTTVTARFPPERTIRHRS